MKKTKFILVLTACAILLGTAVVLLTMMGTASGTCGENLTWVLDKDGTLTISGEGEMYDWSTSNSSWYSDNGSIKDVVIDNGVTSIGDSAFYGCNALTTITIPDSVTSIGDDAFSLCEALTTIKVSENNASYTDIDGVLFTKDAATILSYPAGKTEETYVIPDSVTSIGDDAFSFCVSLTTITIPDSVTSIGSRAFSGCRDLTSITIPNGVTSIGNRAFDSCYALTTITILDGVTNIGNRAFDSCYALTTITVSEDNASYTDIDGVLFTKDAATILVYPAGKTEDTYVIPDSVTSIGDSAFLLCSNLTTITIPDSVTSIGDSAFLFCSNLTTITIPDSVTSIGDSAFCDCDDLTTIIIPDSVTSIGDSAFCDCDPLTSITIQNPECEIYDHGNTISDTATIYGHADSTAQAYAEKYERNFEVIG